MYTNYHRNLKIPSFPLDQKGLEILLKKKADKKGKRPYMYATQNFDEYLNPNLREIFTSLNIFPDVLIIFGHENDSQFQPRSIVHSDIRFQNGSWIDSPCAINWEITDTSANFYWWNVNGAKRCYPPAWSEEQYLPPIESDLYVERLLGSGIHYTEWLNFDSSKYSVIETGVLKKHSPILIRTDIPHSVEYSNYKDRLSISLRFSLEQISNWDSAIKIFKDLF